MRDWPAPECVAGTCGLALCRPVSVLGGQTRTRRGTRTATQGAPMTPRVGATWRSLQLGLRSVLVALVAAASIGCAAGEDAPATASAHVAAGRVTCPNMQLDIPSGWTLAPIGRTRWEVVPPQASSFAAWVVCLDGNDRPPDMRVIEAENAAHLGWTDRLGSGDDLRTMVKTPDGERISPDSVLVGCRQYTLATEQLETCIWADPYPRRVQRADGYLGMRLNTDDAVAVAQKLELSQGVLRTFTVTPTPEHPNDQHP